VDLDAKKVARRVVVGGQPVRVVARRDGTKLYVANANTDDVAIVDRAHFTVDSRITVGGPKGSLAASLRGASPNALALSPDEKTLYVSLGGANAIAIVSVERAELAALVPTGFYPNDVAVSRDGSMIYCAYGKSPTGANPKGPWFDDARVHEKPFQSAGGNQFSLQLHHGGLHAFPKPNDEIARLLTARAIENEHVAAPATVPPIFAALHGKVKHVVYVIAENRTFDQILGDVPGLDGDAKLVHWNASITPNQHGLATTFVGFDRFFDSGGVSGDGWQWSTAGRATDVAEK
jgi:DNA-binding beta-propeller fold protein YncE